MNTIRAVGKVQTPNTIGSPAQFTSLVEEMGKKYGGRVFLGTALAKRGYHQTGVATLDTFLGGGLAKGSIIKLSGTESCGKTSFALLLARSYVGLHLPVQDRRGVLYIDADQSLDSEDLTRYELDQERMILMKTPILEEALEAMFSACRDGFGLIVIDSIASLVSFAELEASKDMTSTADVARMAGLFSKKLSILVSLLSAHGMSAIFINQGRSKIGNTNRYVDPNHYNKGGHMLAGIQGQHIILRKSIMKNKKTKEFVGIKVRVTFDKNKFGPPIGATELVCIPGYPMQPYSEYERILEDTSKKRGRKTKPEVEVEGEEKKEDAQGYVVLEEVANEQVGFSPPHSHDF